jgi:transposase
LKTPLFLEDGTLVLYDVSSRWLEGRCCGPAQFGRSRDSKPNELQIVYGLLCAADGCPVAIEVFDGNTADPKMCRRRSPSSKSASRCAMSSSSAIAG